MRLSRYLPVKKRAETIQDSSETRRLSKKCDRLFTATMLAILWFLIFLAAHDFYYNMVFVPWYFAKHGRQLFISLPLLQAYWGWLTGKVLISLTLVFLLLPIVFFILLTRSMKAFHKAQDAIDR
jgi:hypothetical protein